MFSLSRKKQRRVCLNCNELVSRYWKNIYCSIKCQKEYILKRNAILWLNGEYVSKSKQGVHLKRILKYLRGNKCEKCGWCEIHPITGKVPIELEHKDGNYMNNSPDNVELLCPNCHSLTPTFRALNKGNGREYRRKAATVAQFGRA